MVIELSGADGEHVVVKQRLNGATETQSIEADTTIIIADGDTADRYVGFGVGEKADFRFDDAGTDKAVAASVALRYHYDAHGRVVGRTLDPDGGSPASQYFVYDNDRIVQELDGSGNLVAEWVYGTYIDEVLAMYRDTDGQPGFETYYYIQDDLYNVVALTDDTGEVVERYTYGDYGAPTVWVEDAGNPGTWIENETTDNVPVSSVGNPHMFTGRRWDEVLALYDYRTRYYNPYLGRFLRKDTIGLWGDPNNLGNPYAYCGNNPWSRVDPWGEGPIDLAFTGKWNPSDEDWLAAKGGFVDYFRESRIVRWIYTGNPDASDETMNVGVASLGGELFGGIENTYSHGFEDGDVGPRYQVEGRFHWWDPDTGKRDIDVGGSVRGDALGARSALGDVGMFGLNVDGTLKASRKSGKYGFGFSGEAYTSRIAVQESPFCEDEHLHATGVLTTFSADAKAKAMLDIRNKKLETGVSAMAGALKASGDVYLAPRQDIVILGVPVHDDQAVHLEGQLHGGSFGGGAEGTFRFGFLPVDLAKLRYANVFGAGVGASVCGVEETDPR